MMHLSLILEDQIIVVTVGQNETSRNWDGYVSNSLSGKSRGISLDDKQMAVIVFMAILGDDAGDLLMSTQKEIFTIAEETVKDWPAECRPFP